MTFEVISGILAAALATSGTLTVGYPAGRTRGDFYLGWKHRLITESGGIYVSPTDFELTFNTTASGITLTWRNAGTLPVGTAYRLEVDGFGANVPMTQQINDLQRAIQTSRALGGGSYAIPALLADINLGSPAAAVSNCLCLSQSVGAGASALLNGTVISGGVGVFDVPRNVVAAWTGASVITVSGFDQYGTAITESSASGTSFTGKKAFKRIIAVTFSAAVTGATVGCGTVLGLPIMLNSVSLVLREIMDGTTPTSGTTVAADLTKPTATTGDARGTYAPNSAPDGSRAYRLIVAVGEVAFNTLAQA